MGEFLSSLFANAGTQGAQVAANSLPSMAANAMPQMAQTALGNGVTSFMDTMAPQIAEEGLMSQMGNYLTGTAPEMTDWMTKMGIDSSKLSAGELSGITNSYNNMASGGGFGGLLSDAKGLGGGMMDMLGNEKFATALQGGKGIFDSITNYNSAGDMKDMMNTQLGMQTDAYNRDKEADEKRQLLNF